MVKFDNDELQTCRVPSAKPGPIFGSKFQQVLKYVMNFKGVLGQCFEFNIDFNIFCWLFCRREKRDIPFIVTSCIREVERRGMQEVGIYRVSGSASDLARLKKAFESSKFDTLILM